MAGTFINWYNILLLSYMYIFSFSLHEMFVISVSYWSENTRGTECSSFGGCCGHNKGKALTFLTVAYIFNTVVGVHVSISVERGSGGPL